MPRPHTVSTLSSSAWIQRVIRPLACAALLGGWGCVPQEVGRGGSLKVDDIPAVDLGTMIADDAGVPLKDTGVPPPPPPPPGPDAGPMVTDLGTPDMGQTLNLFPNSTVGAGCTGGSPQNFLVLSETSKQCTEHATWITNGAPTEPAAMIQLPALTAPAQLSVMGTVCVTAADCQPRMIDLRIDTFESGVGASGQWSVQLDGFRGEGEFAAAWCQYSGTDVGPQPVNDVTISEVALYQSVKIPIVSNQTEVTQRNAQLVEGRPALVRVFVDPAGGFTPRQLTARLTVQAPNEDAVIIEEQVQISGASSDNDPGSTFNMFIPPEQMVSGMDYSIAIFDDGGDQCAPQGGGGARFPTTGLIDMDVDSIGGNMKVVLVPVRYNADGSGRLPDTSQAQLDRYRALVYGQFPLPGLELSVRAQPMDWNNTLARNGGGWSALLQQILNLRQQDNAPSDVYYYGIFEPAASRGAFCNGGCVGGLGPVPGANDTYSRGAIGLGFTGNSSAEIAAHELGHALGRRHAPCGNVQTSDQNFPYAGGSIGVWGFDITDNSLKSPTQISDLMGYCDPTWISDYTYRAIFNRLSFVNNQANFAPQSSFAPVQWRVAIASPDSLTWGAPVDLKSPPRGEAIPVAFLDAQGRLLDEGNAQAYPLSHTAEQLILIPPTRSRAALVKISGMGILPL